MGGTDQRQRRVELGLKNTEFCLTVASPCPLRGAIEPCCLLCVSTYIHTIGPYLELLSGIPPCSSSLSSWLHLLRKSRTLLKDPSYSRGCGRTARGGDCLRPRKLRQAESKMRKCHRPRRSTTFDAKAPLYHEQSV